MYEEASVAKKITEPIISSGFERRPIGVVSSNHFERCGSPQSGLVKSVFITDGSMQLTRILSLAHSRAALRVIELTAALVAA